MRKIFIMLFAVPAIVLLAGCKFDEPTMPKADVGLPQPVKYWVGYYCADDFYIEMTYDNRDEDEPIVLFHITDETVDAGINPGVMSLTPSASGAKYTDGIYVWWTKSNEAFLADSSDSENMILSDCIEVVESTTVFGDLNDDDAEDVAMLLIGNLGGSDAFTYLGVRIAEGYDRYDHVSTRLGDSVQVRSIKIESKEVVIELVTQGSNETFCCGTLRVQKSFALQDGELAEVATDELGTVSLGDLMETSWVLDRLNFDQPSLEEKTITLAFEHESEGGRLSGSTGCNDFSAALSSDGGQALTVDTIEATEQACKEVAMAREQTFLMALQNATQWRYDSGRLALSYDQEDGSQGTLLFDLAEASRN